MSTCASASTLHSVSRGILYFAFDRVSEKCLPLLRPPHRPLFRQLPRSPPPGRSLASVSISAWACTSTLCRPASWPRPLREFKPPSRHAHLLPHCSFCRQVSQPLPLLRCQPEGGPVPQSLHNPVRCSVSWPL